MNSNFYVHYDHVKLFQKLRLLAATYEMDSSSNGLTKDDTLTLWSFIQEYKAWIMETNENRFQLIRVRALVEDSLNYPQIVAFGYYTLNAAKIEAEKKLLSLFSVNVVDFNSSLKHLEEDPEYKSLLYPKEKRLTEEDLTFEQEIFPTLVEEAEYELDNNYFHHLYAIRRSDPSLENYFIDVIKKDIITIIQQGLKPKKIANTRLSNFP
ncbi:unnamed protein product [Moneuplotes crassus]|uniref:Uncharacterized protein n=1 Tax=Euplotes crassus TaxID=5936 RepID=A0AAD1XVC3_EUPCR|nr:unnamed protein product [Moneuplotes crassus]